MPKDSDSIFHGGEAGGHGPSFSDAVFENERAMWWAEFEGVGEEAVRGNVERNSYPSIGMEVARQWLARREFLQLRGDVQSIRALAQQAQETASDTLRRASEALALANRVDADSRAIAEITAEDQKKARTIFFVGMTASLFALCAVAMMFAFPRLVAPETKQTSPQVPHTKQAAVSPPPAAAPPAETGPTSAIPPENAPKEQEQSSNIPQTVSPDLKKEQQSSNTSQIESPDLKMEGQSLAEVLALIADKVGGEGTINFTAQFHDMATGGDHAEQLSYKTSNVTIDPNRCQVGYHWHVAQDGRAVSDQDRAIELRFAKNITVGSIDVEAGRRFSMRAYPKVYVVHIARWNNASGDDLYFRDKDMAARVGTAIRHAVELCDNGERQSRRR